MCLPVIEGDKLQSRTLRICRREPVGQRVNRGCDILAEENLLQAFIVIRHPPAAFQGRHGLFGLDLITREHSGVKGILLFFQLDIELTEDLLEGLLQAGFFLLLKKQSLVNRQQSHLAECGRMRHQKPGIRGKPRSLSVQLLQSTCRNRTFHVSISITVHASILLFCFRAHEYQPVQDSCRDRIRAQAVQLSETVDFLFLHGPFEHGHASGILALELGGKLLDLDKSFVLFQGGRH